MSRAEKTILTNMCMIYDHEGNILVQDRVDSKWGGITFPGGHVEEKESFVKSVIREVKEETGLDIENPILCGIKQWQTKDNERYIVLFYKTDKFSGEICSSDEGEVKWIKRSELEKYDLAPDFDKMIEVFESDEISEFLYSVENGEWKINLL